MQDDLVYGNFPAMPETAEDALRESEERYRRLFEVESDAILVIDNETFAITDANAAAQRMYGYTLEELLALTAPELSAEPEKSRLAISSGEKFIPCRLHRRKDGSQFYVETGLSQFEYRRRRMSVVAIRDTTERVRAEKEQKAKIDLLNLCNSAETPLELMRDLADFFRKLADCEAVGVRLKEGEDFPYFVTLGFPLEFILAENSLCAEDIQGHPVFDSAGKPVLECLCGAILNGGVDPSHHFTKNGSFYSNNTAELPADMPGMLLPATRNRCHAEGYLSVALIPLRSQGEAYGLFQFNDRRCGRFSGRTIKYLEDLVNYVAIALAKLIADQSLKRSELALRQAQNLAMLGSYTYDVAADRWSGSEMLGKILGLEKPQGNAAGFAKLLHPLDREEVLAGMAESIALGRRFSHEFRVFRADDGKERWMHDLGDVEYGPHGGPLRIVGIIQDITDRKAAEEKLRGYARRLIELEEDTRRKLATNLHDSIGPDIAVLGINNAMVREKLSPESAGNLGETLDESGRLIESISRKVRSITGELRPPVLDDFGLPASLRWYAELYFKRTGVNVDMQIDEACTTLSGDQELALFRIAQEALNNSAKHAAARNVALSLMYADGAVVLTIADDGTGFIPAKGTDLQSACHWGLILMRERAELFGGKFFLDSAPGTGTTVRVELKGER